MDAQNEKLIQKVYVIWGLIVIVWALYRGVSRLVVPEWMDEFIIKPVVFLTPVFLFVRLWEKKSFASLGITAGKWVRDVYLGVGFGLLFAIVGMVSNSVKTGTISIIPAVSTAPLTLVYYLLLSLAAGFTEELLVRGFFFTRLREGYNSQLKALVVSAVMYLVILVPAIFSRLSLDGATVLVFVMTNIVLSLANTMIFSETKTLTVPVLIHAFWNMAVLLYI